jgi:mono/diheme cytochrome c family protein
MKRVLRILGIILLVIVVILAIGAAVVYARSEQIIKQTYEYEVPEIVLPEANEELMAEGRRIFVTRGCSGCHTANGGGQYMINEPIIAVLPAPNITHGLGGRTEDFGTEDYMRAIMHGIGGDGHGLAIMPSESYSQWREEEIVPLLVFLTNMPPVDNELEARTYGPIGRVILTLGVFPIAPNLVNHETAGLIELEAEPSIEYGQYLSRVCTSCHGSNLAGAADPEGNGNSANLTPSESGIGSWTEEDFTTALRTGSRPDGSLINPELMPWPAFSAMTDVEIQAIYAYLRSIAPVENAN